MKRLLLYVYLYMLVMFLAVNSVIIPVYSRAVRDYLQPYINPYWRDMVRGPYHVIESMLKDLPLEQWSRAVEIMQRHFAYPIEIKPMDAKQRPQAEALALRRGEIVVQGLGESFEHQIGTSGLVLRMGPMPEVGSGIPDIESKVRWCKIQLYLSIIVIFFGFALIWTLPFARNLKGLSKAAVAFGQGTLDARAQISRRSTLSPLAGVFNSMADRIQELIASHKELTHTVSHELRTPLARIRFNLEMMGSAVERSEREKHHDEIRRNVDELDMLVSELLTYARFDHRNYCPETEELELGPWLKALIAAYHNEDDAISIDCRINSLDPEVPGRANPRMLERAVYNLLQNAVRHCRQRIHVTLETTDNHCLIHVDDDGTGVAESNRRKIFEPFVQLETAKKAEAHGYGLGLAIVQRVAQWHGGQVMIESAPIGGARFTIRWPNPSNFSDRPQNIAPQTNGSAG